MTPNRMNPLTLKVCYFGAALSICSALSAEALAGKVVAEKNCSVRIDEELAPGQKVFVVRETNGREKKIAVVQISRSSKGLSLGKVVKGPKVCTALKGLSVVAAGDKAAKASAGKDGGSDGSSGSGFAQPALDAAAQFQYIMSSGEGLHQRTDEKVPSLKLFGGGIQVDMWPGVFLKGGHSLLAQMFGLGVRYSYAMAIPEIDVQPPKDAASQDLGKQQTIPTTLLFEGAVRYPYLEGKFATEVRIGYLMHTLTHTLSTQGGLPRPPLRNTSYSGVSLGLWQRARFGEMVRANLGVTLPIAMSGNADMTSERTVDRSVAFDGELKSPAGLLVDASIDGIIGKFKASVGITYETYGSKVTLDGDVGDQTLDETYFTFLVGLGVHL